MILSADLNADGLLTLIARDRNRHHLPTTTNDPSIDHNIDCVTRAELSAPGLYEQQRRFPTQTHPDLLERTI